MKDVVDWGEMKTMLEHASSPGEGITNTRSGVEWLIEARTELRIALRLVEDACSDASIALFRVEQDLTKRADAADRPNEGAETP